MGWAMRAQPGDRALPSARQANSAVQMGTKHILSQAQQWTPEEVCPMQEASQRRQEGRLQGRQLSDKPCMSRHRAATGPQRHCDHGTWDVVPGYTQ